MSGHKNVIELDGKLYDTATGKVVGASHNTKTHKTPKGVALDGFLHKPKVHHAAHVNHQPQVIHPSAPTPKPVEAPKPPPKPVAHHAPIQHPKPPVQRTEANHLGRKPSRAKTLMRGGLKKPAHKNHAEAATHVAGKSAAHTPERLERARLVSKSAKISRFGSMAAQPHTFVKKTAPLPVKTPPTHAAKQHKPIVSHHSEPPIPTQNQLIKEHLVSQAIKDARVPQTHHKRVKKHRVSKKLGVSPKVLHFGAGALAAVLLFGFITYQNAPNISMQIASARAGFNASIPGYKPSGFGLSGPIEYGPGQVTLNFKSNSDERNFHVTQKVSNWNSEALLSNFVATDDKSYQTYQDKGKTIYIYDGSNATWVSGGVWYQIEGNSSLSSDQLIRLASSI